MCRRLDYIVAERSEAVVIIFVNYHNIVERSETVVIQIMKIVDCHVLRSIELLKAVSTVASSKNRVVFRRDDHFFALQMVNFSSLHDEEWPAEVGH
jgi:hypothetical protein